MRGKKITVLAVILALCMCFTACGDKNTETKSKNKAKNDKNIVTASGIISAEEQYTVSTTAMADILSADFKEGDRVHKGQSLYVLEQKDIRSSISKAQNAIDLAKLSYSQAEQNISKLSVKSGASGSVTAIYVNDGEMVSTGIKVADIIDDSKMKLSVPFISELAGNIYVGQSANVSIVGTFYTATGTVTDISSGELIMNGSRIRMVEITINNPGTLKKGDKGTATIGANACNDSGTFDYSGSHAVYSEAVGRVAKKNVKVGDKVGSGSTIVTLTNDSYTNGLKQAKLSLDGANIAMKQLNDQLENYNIIAKLDGTVIKKNVDKNDTLSAVNMGNLAVIADLSKIILKVNVDEIDVKKIKNGTAVTVTADADKSKKYSGHVETVSESATNVNGVALYEVKIVLDECDGLMPGMNASAEFDLR